MNLRAIGCSFRSAPVDLREKIAFDAHRLSQALTELAARYGCEAALISTCNRVELYLAKSGQADGDTKAGPTPAPEFPPPDADLIAEFLGEFHQVPTAQIRPHLYEHGAADAVQHLFRVAASLDSLIVGEGQIAGQVKQAFEFAQKCGTTGPLLNTLFPAALRAAKRARTETGIAHGHISVSSVAVDYVRQVFDRFDDKTVLVIGAGKMGQLTLKHLRELRPKRILVTNRTLEKALPVAEGCGGQAVPWEQLDESLVHADIVLSTTGAPEVIMPRRRFDAIRARRAGGPVVIIDIGVPRDFDPRIHDGDTTFLYNIDDLTRIREQTIAQRRKHIAPAEAIVEQERRKFVEEWAHRRNAPVIRKLTQDCDAKRKALTEHLFGKLNGKLSDADKEYIEGAFRLFQQQLLHGPLAALREASREGGGASLADAVRKLFRLGE